MRARRVSGWECVGCGGVVSGCFRLEGDSQWERFVPVRRRYEEFTGDEGLPPERDSASPAVDVWAAVRGLRETGQDAEGQGLRIVHGAGWGMWWVMALVVGWRKAIRSFRFRSGLRLKATTAFGRAEGVRAAPCDANNA